MSSYSIDVFVDRDDQPEFRSPLVLRVADDAYLDLPSGETDRRTYTGKLLYAAGQAYREAGGEHLVLGVRDGDNILVDGKRYVLAGSKPEPKATDTRDVVTVERHYSEPGSLWCWQLSNSYGHRIERGARGSRENAVESARRIFANRPDTRLDLGGES